MIDHVLVKEAIKVKDYDERMECSEAISVVERSNCPTLVSSFLIRQKLVRGILDYFNSDEVWAFKQFKWGAGFLEEVKSRKLNTTDFYLSDSVHALLCLLCGVMCVILNRADHLEEMTILLHDNQPTENKTMFYIVFSRILEKRALVEGTLREESTIPHTKFLQQSIQAMIKGVCLAGDSDPFLVHLYDRLAVNIFLCGRAHLGTLSFFLFLHDYFKTCIDIKPLRAFGSELFAKPSISCTDSLIRRPIKERALPNKKSLWTTDYLIDRACIVDGSLREMPNKGEIDQLEEKSFVDFGYSCIELWVSCYKRKHSKMPSPIQVYLQHLN